VSPEDGAETRFALARALWDSGGDRRRARAVAKESSELYARVGSRVGRIARERDALREWLEQHPG
jgi:hypothetical protein